VPACSADHIPSSHDPSAALMALAAELDSRDYTATLVTDDGAVPYLRVSSRHAQLGEDIYVDGQFYRWPWGQPIAAIGNPQAAASKVAAVLAATPEPARG
jgi:hypothetical protein